MTVHWRVSFWPPCPPRCATITKRNHTTTNDDAAKLTSTVFHASHLPLVQLLALKPIHALLETLMDQPVVHQETVLHLQILEVLGERPLIALRQVLDRRHELEAGKEDRIRCMGSDATSESV